jgi:hypothetical protein
MNYQKYEKDGKVAVLVSPGYGAGWSTWADYEDMEALCMDADLVQCVLDKDIQKLVRVAEEKYPNNYNGGAVNLIIEWVDKGEAFEITEYDGHESLVVVSKRSYMTA